MALIDVLAKNYNHKEKLFKILNNHPDELPVINRVGQISHSLPYQDKHSFLKLGEHIGQRKLIMNEIQFLSMHKEGYCVYAGSAPGNKTYLLSQLFPKITFILVDPNEFNLRVENNLSHRTVKNSKIVHISVKPELKKKLKSNIWDGVGSAIDFIKKREYKIYIYEELMTNALAADFAPLDVTFISDIRTNYENGAPSDLDIYWNNSMMYNWIYVMEPRLSMLKFRTIFTGENKKIPEFMMPDFELSKSYGLDFLDMISKATLKMPTGILMIQPWQGRSSTELRLLIKKSDIRTPKTYDSREIENKMFYYNCIERCLIKHTNPNANRRLNFCYCNDCALENEILTNYGMSRNKIFEFIKKINTITFRPLSKVHKFPIWKSFDQSLISDELKEYKASST